MATKNKEKMNYRAIFFSILVTLIGIYLFFKDNKIMGIIIVLLGITLSSEIYKFLWNLISNKDRESNSKPKKIENSIKKFSGKSNKSANKKFDVFICHATKDKKQFVEPLAKALKKENINVWYDDFILEWGDSLRESIDKGLINSRFGIVVFSKAFMDKKKKWTKHELDGLFAREVEGKKVILPVWHNISRDDLLEYSPAFADRLAKSSDSIENIVKSIKKLLEK